MVGSVGGHDSSFITTGNTNRSFNDYSERSNPSNSNPTRETSVESRQHSNYFSSTPLQSNYRSNHDTLDSPALPALPTSSSASNSYHNNSSSSSSAPLPPHPVASSSNSSYYSSTNTSNQPVAGSTSSLSNPTRGPSFEAYFSTDTAPSTSATEQFFQDDNRRHGSTSDDTRTAILPSSSVVTIRERGDESSTLPAPVSPLLTPPATGLGGGSHSMEMNSAASTTGDMLAATTSGSNPNSISNGYADPETVPVGFDEGALRGLCELDCGMPLLVERMKQGMASCREAAMFLKKRAVIEEEYARSMMKLTRMSKESYSMSEGKAGSYVSSWLTLLRTHEYLGENRLKFSGQLSEMSEELVTLAKEVEKSRKTSRDLGMRFEKGLVEQDSLVDKARQRLDSATEDLERVLISKSGPDSLRDPYNNSQQVNQNNLMSASSNSGFNPNMNGAKPAANRTFGKAMSKLKGPKTIAQVAKQEDECRSRVGQCTDAYRSQVIGAQSVRNEYFNLQLPKILRALKEGSDQCDLGTQYHLSRYSYLLESTLVNDGMSISPMSAEDGPGLKAIVESIDNREDFKTFMTQYALRWQNTGQRGPRREGPSEDSIASSIHRPSMSPRINSNVSLHSITVSQPTFGVDLGEQMARDNVEVPRVLVKCCEAIEQHGLDSMGIYRLSGTTSKVQRLKGYLDRDVEGVDLFSEENLSDINNTSAVLKLWFRELPEPLLTWELYHGFVEAAKIENDRLRHIRLHERVNDLPDPNYATLKYLMGHLDKVKKLEAFNQMGCSNLAIVFGPNLLGAPPTQMGANGNSSQLADMALQCKCIETILEHFEEIFVEA